jgi:hypothetical protein
VNCGAIPLDTPPLAGWKMQFLSRMVAKWQQTKKSKKKRS